MWLTSNKPTPVRTAMCSAIKPPPLPGYSTGMSQPPKSTILALRARWVTLRAVFLSAEAAGDEVAITVGYRNCARSCVRSDPQHGTAERSLRQKEAMKEGRGFVLLIAAGVA